MICAPGSGGATEPQNMTGSGPARINLSGYSNGVVSSLALVDLETPLWLDPAATAARDQLVFHCSAPVVATPRQALFAVIAEPLQLTDFALFNPGSDDPELMTLAQQLGLRVVQACSIVDVGFSPSEFPDA